MMSVAENEVRPSTARSVVDPTSPTVTCLERPVLVTGTPRSGKSLIACALGNSPDFLWVQEPLTIWDVDFQGRGDDRRLAGDRGPTTKETIRQLCLNTIVGAGKRRYVDDLAYHSLRLPFLHEVMPEKKIIHVVRSGDLAIPEMLYGWTHKGNILRSAAMRAHSVHWRTLPALAKRFVINHLYAKFFGRRATWGPRVPELAEYVKNHSAAEVAAFQWSRMTQIALHDLETLPRQQWMQVRFEDLLADPVKVARQVAEFCEADDPQAVVNHAKAEIRDNYHFPKRVAIDAGEWAHIQREIEPVMKRLGYWSKP